MEQKPRTTIDLEADLPQRLAFAMALATLLVMSTFSLTGLTASLVKKGIPETMNTFLESGQRTYERVAKGPLSALFLNPEDMGFLIGERIAILRSATGTYDAEDYGSAIEVAGSNLDRVRTLSIGDLELTTKGFHYDPGLGTITILIKREPDQIADRLTAQDFSRADASIPIRWPTGATLSSGGARVVTRLAGAKTPATTGPAAVEASDVDAEEAWKEHLAKLRGQVLTLLKENGVTLDDRADRNLREETFEKRNESLFLSILGTVVYASSLQEESKRTLVRGLLELELFQEYFLRLNSKQLTVLVSPSNSMDRIVEILWDKRGPGYLLQRSGLSSSSATAETTSSGSGTGGPEIVHLKAAEFRKIFRAEEPFRICLANQEKIRFAAEQGLEQGLGAANLDLFALVRQELLPTTLQCPEAGRYGIEVERGAVQVTCRVHGNSQKPSKEHERFAKLFGLYERARGAVLRERRPDEFIPVLEKELARQPENAYIAYLLGRAYIQTQEFQKAHSVLKPISDDTPGNVAYSYFGGFSFYAAGNIPLADLLLSRALQSSSFSDSEEDVLGRADYYLMLDKCRWLGWAVAGRPVRYTDEGAILEEEIKPKRFIDFSRLSEPEYPSEKCLRGIRSLTAALGPIIEAFQQDSTQDRLTEFYSRYARDRTEFQRQRLEKFLQSLAREYLGMAREAMPVCPDRGAYRLERQDTKYPLQCTKHRDIDPEALGDLKERTPGWKLHALNNLIFYLHRLKNRNLHQCLENQLRIYQAFKSWDDPRRTPALSDLIAEGKVPQKSGRCPERNKPYSVTRLGLVNCLDHEAIASVQRRLSTWRLPRKGDR